MISISLKTPYEIAQSLAKNMRIRRLSLNLSQKTLSSRSGVSYGVIKKFEQTGQISLKSLLMISLVLDELPYFEKLFTKENQKLPISLDELLKEEPIRKRGRK